MEQETQMSRNVQHEDILGNPCVWIATSAALIVIVVLTVVVLVTVPTTAAEARRTVTRVNPTLLVRQANPRVIPSTSHAAGGVVVRSQSQCKTGEEYDRDSEMCAPAFHAPLAFNGPIMDGHYTACDSSFYHMMCGVWMREHVNENRAFTYGYHKTQRRIRNLIIPAAAAAPLNSFYRSCMDRGSAASWKETRIEYVHVLQAVMGDLRSHADLPMVWGRLARRGYTAPFVVSIERHPTERKMLPLIIYDGFPTELMEESAIYRVLVDSRSVTQYNTVEEQQRIQGIMRVSHALRTHRTFKIEEVQDYKDYISRIFPDHHVRRFDALPHEWYVGGTAGEMRGWNRFFEALSGEGLRFSNEQQMWIPDASYLEWLLRGRGMADIDIGDWKAWVEFSVLYNGHQFYPELASDAYFRTHDERGPIGEGARIYHRLPRRRRKRDDDGGSSTEAKCLRLVQHMMPGLVAEQFLKRYMSGRAADQQEAIVMVHSIMNALSSMVSETPWLLAEDKQKLLNKISKTLIRVAEPSETWESEPFSPAILADRYDHNINLVRRYRVERNLALWLRGAPDAWNRAAIAFFAIPLTDMNAYYSGPTNSITILAGIMQIPFYDRAYNMVSKYAILGSIIGHELSHMLDHHGLYWDASGEFRPRGIISQQGMSRFYDESECVIREYGPAPGGCESSNVAYGNSTASEDLADLVGFQASYRALFEHSTFSASATMGDKQHFFMILAQAFCESYDQAHRCEAVASDEHAVGEYRIDRTYKNMPMFPPTFGCHAGQGMYQNPSQMCIVWGKK